MEFKLCTISESINIISNYHPVFTKLGDSDQLIHTSTLIHTKGHETRQTIKDHLQPMYKELQWFSNNGVKDPQTMCHVNAIFIHANDMVWNCKITGLEGPTERFSLLHSTKQKSRSIDVNIWTPINRDHQGCVRRHRQFNTETSKKHHTVENGGQKSEYIAECCMLQIGMEKLHFKNRIVAIVINYLVVLADVQGNFETYTKYLKQIANVTNVTFTKQNDDISVKIHLGNDRRSLTDPSTITKWIPETNDFFPESNSSNGFYLTHLREAIKHLLAILNVFNLNMFEIQTFDAWDLRTIQMYRFGTILQAVFTEKIMTPYITLMMTQLPLQIEFCKKVASFVPIGHLFSSDKMESKWRENKNDWRLSTFTSVLKQKNVYNALNKTNHRRASPNYAGSKQGKAQDSKKGLTNDHSATTFQYFNKSTFMQHTLPIQREWVKPDKYTSSELFIKGNRNRARQTKWLQDTIKKFNKRNETLSQGNNSQQDEEIKNNNEFHVSKMTQCLQSLHSPDITFNPFLYKNMQAHVDQYSKSQSQHLYTEDHAIYDSLIQDINETTEDDDTETQEQGSEDDDIIQFVNLQEQYPRGASQQHEEPSHAKRYSIGKMIMYDGSQEMLYELESKTFHNESKDEEEKQEYYDLEVGISKFYETLTFYVTSNRNRNKWIIVYQWSNLKCWGVYQRRESIYKIVFKNPPTHIKEIHETKSNVYVKIENKNNDYPFHFHQCKLMSLMFSKSGSGTNVCKILNWIQCKQIDQPVSTVEDEIQEFENVNEFNLFKQTRGIIRCVQDPDECKKRLTAMKPRIDYLKCLQDNIIFSKKDWKKHWFHIDEKESCQQHIHTFLMNTLKETVDFKLTQIDDPKKTKSTVQEWIKYFHDIESLKVSFVWTLFESLEFACIKGQCKLRDAMAKLISVFKTNGMDIESIVKQNKKREGKCINFLIGMLTRKFVYAGTPDITDEDWSGGMVDDVIKIRCFNLYKYHSNQNELQYMDCFAQAICWAILYEYHLNNNSFDNTLYTWFQLMKPSDVEKEIMKARNESHDNVDRQVLRDITNQI